MKRILLLCLWTAAAAWAADDLDDLRQELAEQRALIAQLQAKLDRQAAVIERISQSKIVPAALVQNMAPAETKSVNGFQFSGDFRLRLDAQLRSGNNVAPPLQNVRSR